MVALAERGAVLMPEHLSPPFAPAGAPFRPGERILAPTESSSASINRCPPPSSISSAR